MFTIYKPTPNVIAQLGHLPQVHRLNALRLDAFESNEVSRANKLLLEIGYLQPSFRIGCAIRDIAIRSDAELRFQCNVENGDLILDDSGISYTYINGFLVSEYDVHELAI